MKVPHRRMRDGREQERIMQCPIEPKMQVGCFASIVVFLRR